MQASRSKTFDKGRPVIRRRRRNGKSEPGGHRSTERLHRAGLFFRRAGAARRATRLSGAKSSFEPDSRRGLATLYRSHHRHPEIFRLGNSAQHMALIRPRLNDHFALPFTQEEADFAIPFLDDDIPLYVDPFLL